MTRKRLPGLTAHAVHRCFSERTRGFVSAGALCARPLLSHRHKGVCKGHDLMKLSFSCIKTFGSEIVCFGCERQGLAEPVIWCPAQLGPPWGSSSSPTVGLYRQHRCQLSERAGKKIQFFNDSGFDLDGSQGPSGTVDYTLRTVLHRKVFCQDVNGSPVFVLSCCHSPACGRPQGSTAQAPFPETERKSCAESIVLSTLIVFSQPIEVLIIFLKDTGIPWDLQKRQGKMCVFAKYSTIHLIPLQAKSKIEKPRLHNCTGRREIWLKSPCCFMRNESFSILIMLVVTQLCAFVKIHRILYLKRVYFTVCRFYLYIWLLLLLSPQRSVTLHQYFLNN